MHADEAIYAHKLGTLLETGAWTYEPGEHHGPILHYVTAATSKLAGARNYLDLTETTLRIIPVLFGLVLVLIPLLLSSGVGRAQALAASAMTAISPAMVYYSRYYIPEVLLTCLTAGLIVVGYHYARTPNFSWAIGFGLLFGLAFATKETALIVAGSMLLAALALARKRRPDWRHLAVAGITATIVVVALLGPRELVQSIGIYVNRAMQGERHFHPWHYYLRLLFWSEGAIVVLAAMGAVASIQDGGLRFPRFLALYTVAMTAIYSLIPYKTPWCLLGFLQGMILLAGMGLVFVAGKSKLAAIALLAVGGLQVLQVLRQDSSDSRNLYAYVHTTRDVFTIRDRLEKLASTHEQGRNLPIQVISPQNVWPLPWYLRSFPAVEWRRGVTDDMRPAPVILASPDMEPALIHHLYEVLPPGQRPLYVNLFADYTELRPGVELRGYVQQSLWGSINASRGILRPRNP